MVPPWTPPVPPPEPPVPPVPHDEELPPQAPPPVPLAPPMRFGPTRRALGDFGRTGNNDDLRRGLGHYVSTGYGGAATTARRFGGTASTASALGTVLANIAGGQPASASNPVDATLLAGRSVDEVLDALVQAARQVDGTQDAEAERLSVRNALTDVLDRFPDANLLNLDAAQREFAIERFTAFDVFQRFELDVGLTIQAKAPSPTSALSRLKEARDYIRQAVEATFRKLKAAGRGLDSGRVNQVVHAVLQETFEVFAGYVE